MGDGRQKVVNAFFDHFSDTINRKEGEFYELGSVIVDKIKTLIKTSKIILQHKLHFSKESIISFYKSLYTYCDLYKFSLCTAHVGIGTGCDRIGGEN